MIHLATRESSLNDPSYRYQIPILSIKAIGKQGNMTTYFLNSDEISKKINMDSMFFGKYISTGLSCQLKHDKEKNCLTFKGNYPYETIYKYFMNFIIQYKLCPNCDYPETTLYKQKSGLFYHCESCGSDDKIKGNPTDKTYEFIEKNIK
jgi:translation initiation factor 5